MINAVTLVTADMARSHAFYDALGFETVLGGPYAISCAPGTRCPT